MPAQTFTEILPPTASCKQSGFKWTPSEDQQGAGLLVIESKRVSVTYLVVKVATRWQGMAWHLAKVTTGTDKDSESYDCFLANNGREQHCSCKGFAYGRGKACKHLSSLASILANACLWEAPSPVNDEADTSSTEVNEIPETW